MTLLLLLSTFLAFPIISRAGESQLGEYITEFSPLFYNSIELHTRHLISKRSLYEKSIDLQLEHSGRKLDLSLYQSDDGIFHPDTIISTDGVDSKVDSSHFYSGYVKGDQKSSVSGSIIKGVFQGIIRTGTNDVYYVERKEYHPSHPLTQHENVHSVIYNQADVDVDKFYEKQRVKRSSNNGFCGRSIENVASYMHRLEGDSRAQATRSKRATTPSNNVCNMFLQSDPEMWKYFEGLFPANEREDTVIKQEITTLFRELIKEVNGIYNNADFGGQTGYELRVDRLAINKTCSTTTDHWFCNKDLDVSNFLNLNTYTNHNAFCLAYILTSRDFADGTLGLAWVAQPGALTGGICSKYRTYSENGSPRDKSLNTGIVTIKNYGERVPQLMSQLTLAHEIGHNFGSEHDPSGCTPYTENGDEDGNFIMYYAAISGKRSNNIKFSSCSENSIGAVLASTASTNCFKAPSAGHCGNQIVDGTERCDCGYTADCDGADCCKCCIGQNEANNAVNACTLATNADCDPSEGPCCAASCGYHLTTVECSPETECSKKSYCNGTAYQCPPSVPEHNGKICDAKTKVCSQGECSESVCTIIAGSWKECSLSLEDTGVDPSYLCMISCEDTNTNQCYSSADTNIPQAFKDMLANVSSTTGISVKPGYPCDKDQGFCDYFLTCRKINELGPFARLKGLLLSLTSLEEFTAWLEKYWWAVLLAVLGLGLFTFLLVKFGAYFTPSSNPDQPLPRQITKPLTQPERRAGPTAGNRRADDMELR